MLAIVHLVVALALGANVVIASCNLEKPTPALNRTDGSPAGILKLLHEGKQLLELEKEDEDMVVFMGITGSGKTTFVLHIGGNNDDLTSKETRPRSGEYIIQDRCNRSSIASKTLESYTLVPDRFVDAETTVTYFDMPGFSDTRPMVAYDIAATYFSKLVLDFAKRIKLIFVVSYSHIKVGEDRGRFTELVQHVTTLIPDLSKFQDSIALVASKVNNVFRPDAPADYPYVPDEEVAEGIAEFIENAKTFYSENNNTKAVQLMDILLHRSNTTFDRIGIFRRPDKPGPLKSLTTLQRSRQNLRTIIDKNIRFAEKDGNDFGYTLSERSKNMLHKLEEEVLENAKAMIRALGNRILDDFHAREILATNLVQITSVSTEFYPDTKEYEYDKTMANFSRYLGKYARDVRLDVSLDDIMTPLRTNEDVMNFLNGMSGDAAIDWSSTIRNGIGETVEYLRQSRAWYNFFLNAAYDSLSGYEVQRAKSKIESSTSTSNLFGRIKELETLPKVNLAQLDHTMVQFLTEAGEESLPRIYGSLGPINLNKQKLLFLEMILNATLKYEVETSCEDKLTIRGRYVVLSQVADKLQDCSAARSVEILALETIFVDTSLDFTGRKIQLSIIAPLWIVIGHVEITLNGANGRHHETVAHSGHSSSTWSLRNGEHGLPGMPGGSAGHFFGVGGKFVNDEQLTIFAVGGNGGNGQKGGDGYPGTNPPVAPSYDGDDQNLDDLYRGYSYKQTLEKQSGFWRSVGYFLGIAKDIKVYKVEVHSPPGGTGGNGGNGGCGGIGGYGGEVSLRTYNGGGSSLAKIISGRGDEGAPGQAGKGAEGGQPAKTLIETYTEESYWWSDMYSKLRFENYSSPKHPKAQDGSSGASGLNVVGLQSPTPVTSQNSQYPGIEGYMAYARGNQQYDVRRSIPNTLQNLKNLLPVS